MIITVEEHSFDQSRLNDHSTVLDIGCRGFMWSAAVKDMFHCRVVSVDADPDICPPPGFDYHNLALSTSDSPVTFYSFGNGTGSYTSECGPRPAVCEEFQVDTICPEGDWSLIKLDCEGAEWDWLMSLDEPPADQLSIEFHLHVFPRSAEEIKNMWYQLNRWYTIHNWKMERKHGCSENMWDVVCVKK